MKESNFVLEETVLSLLDEKKYVVLRELLNTMHAADIAILMEEIPEEQLLVLYRLLPKELAAETFVEMETDHQELLIRSFTDSELKEVLSELYVDDAVDIIEEMPSNVVKRILSHADPEMRKNINEILNYPEDSAGSIMTTEYVTLTPGMTVMSAIRRIRMTGVDKETIYTCYVTTKDRILIGYISLRTLVMAEDNDIIDDLMGTDTISVKTTDDQEYAASILSKYDLDALPVVDMENRIVGIVTVDDAIDVIEEEATEDIEKMAAITPSSGKSYMKMTTWEIWKNRIPWLLLLMVSATFTGMIISSFEEALAAQVALTAFIPMLMDTAGNSGSQTSVTVIRSMSLGDVEFSDLPRVVWKEIRVAVLCGISLAAASFVKILIVDMWLMGSSDVTVWVALVVCITLAVTVFLSKIVGCVLPMLGKRIGFDPAVMASPFITTIVDALALLVYFQVATLILKL